MTGPGMASEPISRTDHWRLIAAWSWLVTIATGGLLGAAIEDAIRQRFLIGMSVGFAAGVILALIVRGKLTPILHKPTTSPELRARLFRRVIFAVGVGATVYLISSALGIGPSVHHWYPWDGLALLLVCVVSDWLSRRGRLVFATMLFIAIYLLFSTSVALPSGITSSVYALFLPSIIISGLILGSAGFLGAFATVSISTSAFAIGENHHLWPVANPTDDPIRLIGSLLIWWVLYAWVAWLTWLFARSLEGALQISRSQTLTLASALHAITPTSSLDQVLKRILSSIAGELGAAYSVLWLHDVDTDRIRPYFVHKGGRASEADENTDGTILPAQEQQVWQELCRERRPIMIENVADDSSPQFRAALSKQNIQTVLYVPLLSGDQVPGFISIGNTERHRYSPDELELAQALAQQMALAMQLTRLAEQNRRAAVVEERNRMAREIHDTLAQGFTGIVVQLEATEDALGDSNREASQHLSRARALARESLTEARRSVYALRPQSLESMPLSTTMRDSIRKMTADASLSVEWDMPDHWPALPSDLEADLLRLGQEAVTNVLKHASATQLRVALRATPGWIELEVKDNGRGFDPDKSGREGGLGLVGMRERVARHGGALEITNCSPGTRVIARVPVRSM